MKKEALRAELYEVFQRLIGRKMTDNEHEEIKFHVNKYLEQFPIHPPKNKITHELICKKCGFTRSPKGHNYKTTLKNKFIKPSNQERE